MKYAPKIIHTPSHLAKITFTTLPHSHNPTPCKKSPPIDFPHTVPSLLVGVLSLVQTSLQTTFQCVTKSHLESHLSESLDSELVWSSHELGDSSSSTASLALEFLSAWVRTQLINPALLPLTLRPFCFRYIFSCLLVSAITSFVQEISGSVPFSYFYGGVLLHQGTQGAVHNFYIPSLPCCTGHIPLAKTFLQKRVIFPLCTISAPGHLRDT